MFDDDYDRDEIVDLDGCDVTGDPQLDVYGYNSPRRRGENLTGYTSHQQEWVARADARRAEREQRRRAAVEQNLRETRQRVAQRRGQPQPVQQPIMPALAPHVAQAVECGAIGRPAGWYRVDIAPDGTAQWSQVDSPGNGPWITATTPAPQPQPAPARRRWWQRRRHLVQPQPAPGTVLW